MRTGVLEIETSKATDDKKIIHQRHIIGLLMLKFSICRIIDLKDLLLAFIKMKDIN